MNDFFSFQSLEFKRFFHKRKLTVFFIVFVIFVFSVNRSSVSFKRELSNNKGFQKNEAETFRRMSNYTEYSKSGIRFLMQPPPSSIFFSNMTGVSELSSRVNSVALLEVYNNFKGKSIFKGGLPMKLKFSDLVAYLGCFFALFMGAEAISSKEYLKMKRSRIPGWRLHIYTLLSRFIVLIAAFILVSACMLLVPLLHGIGLAGIDTGHLWVYLGWALLMLLFFLLLGHIMGSIARSKLGFTPLFIAVFVFVVVIPTISGSADEDIAESLQSIHKLYHDRLKIVNDWEKRTEEKYGKTNLDNIEVERKIVEEYFEEVYPKIESLEKELRDEIARLIKNHRDRSVWTPITFNNLLCGELSGRGYESYLEFLDFNIRKQREFLRFWINMRYYVHHEDNKLENFFKKEGENIFRVNSKLPGNVSTGFLLHLIYIAILFGLSSLFFHHSLERAEEDEAAKLGVLDLIIEKNKPNAWKCDCNTFLNFLYRLFSGRGAQLIKKGIKGKVLLDEVDLLLSSMKLNFFYLCHWRHFPGDISVSDLITFFASLNNIPKSETRAVLNRPQIKPISSKIFRDLKKREKCTAVLALTYLVKADIYLIDDISDGAPAECAVDLKDMIDELHENVATVILITRTEEIIAYESDGDTCYEDGSSWFFNIEGSRIILANRKQKQTPKPEEKAKGKVRKLWEKLIKLFW